MGKLGKRNMQKMLAFIAEFRYTITAVCFGMKR